MVNSSQGGGTKDTWVLRRAPIMLSRVAENLFWMSRYLERAENVARLLDIGLYLELDAGDQPGDGGSAPVEIALNILACREAFRSAHPDARTHRRPGVPHLRPGATPSRSSA